jgi:hypothetical protein
VPSIDSSGANLFIEGVAKMRGLAPSRRTVMRSGGAFLQVGSRLLRYARAFNSFTNLATLINMS